VQVLCGHDVSNHHEVRGGEPHPFQFAAHGEQCWDHDEQYAAHGMHMGLQHGAHLDELDCKNYGEVELRYGGHGGHYGDLCGDGYDGAGNHDDIAEVHE